MDEAAKSRSQLQSMCTHRIILEIRSSLALHFDTMDQKSKTLASQFMTHVLDNIKQSQQDD
jgi:hypothetical protein